ncbi:MAG: c-type cytochrome, partial [Acidobacteriota bacterium]
DPPAFRSGAMMPGLFDRQQRSDIASYFVSLGAGGSADQTRKPARHDIAKGNQLFGMLGCAACHQEQGLGLDGMGSKTTIGPLAEYLKNPAKFDPGGRMPSMMLTDEEAFQVAAYLVDTRNRDFEQPWKSGDPVRGKELVQSEGCLSCHTLDAAEPLSNRHRAPRLEQVAPARGCLASEPRRGVPNYRLSADRREAIQAFLRSYKLSPDVSHAPVYQLQRSLRKLRCGACHHIDSTVPAATVSDAAPPLTDVGAKLRTGWVEQVLVNRQRVWSGLDLRMPHYDSHHVRPMIDAFALASGVQPGEGPGSPPVTALQSSHGAGMIGTDGNKGGLACIGCHDWGEYKSLGEEGPQLINATRRLRYDWFHRWMLNPARILSGTSMPNYFSSTEPKPAREMIDTLWAALSMGEGMPLPDGLKKVETADVEARPVPEREAIVIRWDMPEATPAAIAVGLPGGISYCFDAGQSRLRYAWKGGFVDMTETLRRKVDSNRLTPTAKLVGEVFYRGDEFPLRLGTTDRIPERRFRGYRVVEGAPEFHYQVDGIEVYERIVAAQNNQGITRQFTVGRVDQPMWFAAGRGAGVVVSSTIGDPKSGPLPIPRGTNVRFSVTITLESRSQ